MSENRHNELPQAGVEADRPDALNDLDVEKLLGVIKSSVLYVVGIIVVTCSCAYLFIRYTKPVYESDSELKLEIQNEAVILGVQNPLENTNTNSLPGEIELLRSNLFLSKVVDAINYDVSYYFYGKILNEERYRNSPFAVSYKIHNSGYYDKQFDLEIKNRNRFTISYESGGALISSEHQFGESINTENISLLVHRTDAYSEDNGPGKYYFTINSKTALISYLQSNVSVQPLNFSAKTIRVSLRDFNKHKARDFVTAIDTLYLQFTKEAKNLAIEQKLRFLNEQLSLTESKIEGYENYFESFTIENRTTDIQGDLGNTIVFLKALDSQRFDLQNKLANVEILQAQLNRNEPLLLSAYSSRQLPGFITSALEEYSKNYNEREVLLGSYNENTHAVSRIDQRLDVLRKNTLELVEEYETGLAKSIKELDTRKTNLEKNFVELPSMGTEFSKTRRFYNLQEEFYFSLIKSKAELEIAKAGMLPNFVILSPASLPGAPVHPRQLIIYGIGIVSGIIFSLMFVTIRYLLHNKISSQRELERLINTPVLGSVPFYKKEKMPVTRLVVHKNPKSVISESLRSIRTNMDFLQSGGEKKVIAVTSTISGEGKTFIVVNLGAIFAQTGKKVLVVDLDMRKPKIHQAFNKEKDQKGMSTILIGRDDFSDCINKTEVEGLFYLPAGPTPPNPSELLLGAAFDDFLQKAKTEFDIVILDTPPVGLVTDGVIVMRKTDLSLYVVRANYSRKAFLKTLQKLNKMNRYNHISLVLNSVDLVKSNGYGYGYGYGYGNGYYEEDDFTPEKT